MILDRDFRQRYNNLINGLVAQLGAHHIRIVGVEGSNPFKSIKGKSIRKDGFLFVRVLVSRISI